jgi:hypothetical protein
MAAHNGKNLDHIMERMRTDDSVDAPPDAIRYAKNLFRARGAAAQPSLLRRIVAAVAVDLAPGVAALGERSGGETAVRQILFEAGENAVDLRITNVADGFSIRGQVLGPGFEDGMITVEGEIGRPLTSDIDSQGGFDLASLPAGSYQITVRGKDAEIVVPDLLLG